MKLVDSIKDIQHVKELKLQSDGVYTLKLKDSYRKTHIAKLVACNNDFYRLYGAVTIASEPEEKIERFVKRYNMGKGAFLFLKANNQKIVYEILLKSEGDDFSKLSLIIEHIVNLKEHCKMYLSDLKEEVLDYCRSWSDIDFYELFANKEASEYYW